MSYSLGGYSFEELTKALITKIMFPWFPQYVCVDTAVVLGAGNVCKPFCDKVLELYKNGQINHVIVCGGAVINDLPDSHKQKYEALKPSAHDGETEADWMEAI